MSCDRRTRPPAHGLSLLQAFGTIGPIETAYFRETGKQVLFSEQDLMDCGWYLSNKACFGGYQVRLSFHPVACSFVYMLLASHSVLFIRRAAALATEARIATVLAGPAQRSTAQHSAPQHSTVHRSTTQQNPAKPSTAQHSTAQHSTAQHSTFRHNQAKLSTAQHSHLSLQRYRSQE